MAAVFCFFWAACASTAKKDSRTVSVMNWNVETFFDAQKDGTEYKEFLNPKTQWSKEKYEDRLDRLASVIKTLNCDVIVLEEIEKAGQIKDIKNRLSSFFWKTSYKYSFFAIEKGAAIGCAVLSRYPISKSNIHSLDIQCGKKQPSMRPIMRVELDIKGKPLVLLVNHWKSKAGGAKESDIWRDYQEKLLSRLIKESTGEGKAVVACGDFNRSIEEFRYEKKAESNVTLKGGAEVFSPWYNDSGELLETGSYFFRGNWERIDNFFLAGGAVATKFKAENSGEWANAEGKPRRYSAKTGRGYSDHLPLSCKISF